MTPQRRANRARARAAGALLPPRLFLTARDETARLGRRGSRTAISQLHLHRLVQNRFVARAAEDRARDLDFANALARSRKQRHLDRLRMLSLSHWPTPPDGDGAPWLRGTRPPPCRRRPAPHPTPRSHCRRARFRALAD